MPTELPPRWTGKRPPTTKTFYQIVRLRVGRLTLWLGRMLKR
jgi:hypothetical protein